MSKRVRKREIIKHIRKKVTHKHGGNKLRKARSTKQIHCGHVRVTMLSYRQHSNETIPVSVTQCTHLRTLLTLATNSLFPKL